MVVTALSKGGKHAAIRLSQHTRQVDAVGAELRELPRFRSEEGVGASAAALRRVSGRRQECRRGPGGSVPAPRGLFALRFWSRSHGVRAVMYELLQPRVRVEEGQECERAPAARIQAIGAIFLHALGQRTPLFSGGCKCLRGVFDRTKGLGHYRFSYGSETSNAFKTDHHL